MDQYEKKPGKKSNPAERRKFPLFKAFPLRQNFAYMVALLWVLPILLVVTYTNYDNVLGRQQSIEDMVLTAADGSFHALTGRVSHLISAACRPEQLPDIAAAYGKYQTSGNGSPLEAYTEDFLAREYSRQDDGIDAAMLYYADDPDRIFCGGPDDLAARQIRNRYLADDHAYIRSRLSGAYADPFFVQNDDRLYLVKCFALNETQAQAVVILRIHQEFIMDCVQSIPWQLESLLVVGEASVGGLAIPQGDLFAETEIGSPVQMTSLREEKYLTAGAYADGGIPVFAAVLLDKSALAGGSHGMVFVLMVIVAAVFMMITTVIYIFENKVNAPIHNLVKAYRRLEQGELGFRLPVDKSHSTEFAYLTERFNTMSAGLKNRFEEQRLEAAALRDARMKALQSQINPHFLNNTLELINWESRLAGSTNAVGMLEALSTMLEAAIDRTGAPLIPLSQEIEYVDAYLFIISKRFGNRLEVIKNIDESVLGLRVPRLILQPIIENAVEHGTRVDGSARVTLSITREDGFIRIIVKNAGIMTAENAKRIECLLGNGECAPGERATNIGIRNTNERLKLIFGADCGLSIYSTDDGETVSEIRIEEAATDMVGR